MLFAKDLVVNTEYDVIVAGGGPSGCTAAAAAARGGAKTLLLEATGALGGMSTMGGVPAWCPFSDQEKIIYKGFAEEIFTKAKQDVLHIAPSAMDWVPIVPEKLKRIFDDFVTGYGVDVLFGTQLAAVESSDGVVERIIVANKDGLTAYQAKIYIDCTGDGDLSAWAGAEYVKGDVDTGDMQMATLCFSVANVDMYAYIHGENLHDDNPNSPIHEILKSKKFPYVIDSHFCQNIIGPGVVGFNAGHISSLDATNPKSLSEGYIRGRKIANEIVEALRTYVPSAFANAFLTTTAPLMGVRESRRILGDYVLTVEDYIEKRSFDDEIGRCSYFIDIHANKSGEGSFQGKQVQYPRYGKGESFGIPFRCLTPKGFKNLLTAGRIISCDRAILGSVRVMPPAMVTGEAAGNAAAKACITGDIRKL